MNNYLGCDITALEAGNSAWTAREICQQPAVWREAHDAVERDITRIQAWLTPVMDKPGLQIVLCGAGSSAFVGEALAPALRQQLNRRVDAISTTDIVSAPDRYLAKTTPTLLISFARSGDSPESVASVELADQFLDDCHHLVLTCNSGGHLARAAQTRENMLCLLMPEGTNDRSFAMTSSFTSMLVACAAIFAPDSRSLDIAAGLAQQLIDEHVDNIGNLANRDFNRLVVLGSGCLQGIAMEASLKCLELSAGEVVPLSDSPLGFRHGPKSVVNKRTVIIHLQSASPYTGAYDRDLLEELQADDQAMEIIALSPEFIGGQGSGCPDLWLTLPYLVYCQILAFFKALDLGIGADNPCPTGEVNRVVQGVTLHPFGKA